MRALEAGAYVLLLAVLVAVLFSAATCDEPPRVYPAAEELLNRTPDAMVLEVPLSGVRSSFVEEVLRLHHEAGGETRD